MKILVLSFYFEPDLCAGSFRATALVNEFARVMPAGSHLYVVTTLPNRYKTFSVKAPQIEHRQNITINRLALPLHQSGMLDQAKAFWSFARQVLRLVKSSEYDLVFATSSRLMTAVLGAWIARQKKALLYLDIRDIFVDTIKDVLPRHLAVITKPFFSALEQWAFRCSATINLVSQGFEGYFVSRYAGQRLSFFTNGIDDEFIAVAPLESGTQKKEKGTVTVLYAGNIGEGQGLHAIIPELAKRMRSRVHFRIIGDGGRLELLRTTLKSDCIDNVELLPPVKRDQLINAYKEADVLFLHLNDYEAFRKVLPSKLFEYAAMGKPLWAGVSGYAAEFIQSEIDNSAVFDPCDVLDAEQAFASLLLRDAPRTGFINKYARGKIMKEMAQDILQSAERRSLA
ncbi:MAG: glycosyltransferase family 4 protein [Desulfobulbaceae bacterium]|nr:glycosyltransferase family 4 protein [Desulfobulbaceae bacterium]